MHKIWFRRKKYGWGWTPATWEGWLVTIFFIGVMALVATARPASATFVETLQLLLVPVLLFISVCFIMGETPRWQWGDKKDDASGV